MSGWYGIRCRLTVALSAGLVTLGCNEPLRIPSVAAMEESEMPSTARADVVVPRSQRLADEEVAGLPRLFVGILESVESLEGAEWPRGYDGLSKEHDQPRRWVTHPTPSQVTVRLPSGLEISSYSTATFVMQQGGVVNGVELMPLRSAVPLQAAILELENLFKAWNLKPDGRAKQNIVSWKTHGDVKPDPLFLVDYQGYASIPGEDRAFVSFQIRPARGKGWFLVMEVGLTMDERRKLWSTGPATKPTN